MVEWSLDAFRSSEPVARIVVACPPGHDVSSLSRYAGQSRHSKAIEAVDGGATRSQSVANALAAVTTELVAIHDAARPLLTPELVEALVDDLESDPGASAVIAAGPVVDTIKEAAGSIRQLSTHEGANCRMEVGRTLDRSTLWAAQTPQVFRAEALREALAASPDPDAATDEAMLVEMAGGRVLIHPVTEPNLKVTTPLDLRLAELLLAERAD
jgi:2-C-methyl-D-erythritol 4-phosphate cytidylyltransferase